MDDLLKETKTNKGKTKKLVLTRPKMHPMEDVNLRGIPKPEEVFYQLHIFLTYYELILHWIKRNAYSPNVLNQIKYPTEGPKRKTGTIDLELSTLHVLGLRGGVFEKVLICLFKNLSSLKFTQKVKVPFNSAFAVFYQHSASFSRFICSICL